MTGGTVNYSYPSTNSKLSSVGADSYSYDAMGSITDDDALAYTWNAAALLGEVKTSGTSTVLGTYTYDASNLRTKKVAGGNTVHYVYGLGGLLYGEYDNSGALIREYVWLNGESLAQVDAGSPEVLTYLHTDHLATPRYGTNAGGSTVWTWDSGAFGKEAATGSATVNLRFPGQYRDAETGLHYNWNRYYNPATGRYVSSDPIGLAGGLNTFGYAGQSPLEFSDPAGLVLETAWDVAVLGYDISNGDWWSVGADICAIAIPILPAGWNKVGDAIDAAGDLAKGAKSADEAADIAKAAGKKRGAASQLDVDGETFTDISKNRNIEDLHPDLQEVLDDVPIDQRPPWHGKCAEIGCIDQSLKEGIDPRGGDMTTVGIGKSGHKEPKAPCPTCEHVQKKMGVNQK